MGWIRRVRTLQEKRANQEGWCRAKRRPHRLPDSWDDGDRTDWQDRCWKRYRKTQYKVKTARREKKSSRRYAEHMARRRDFWYEHRHCAYRYARCDYCWKHRIWEGLSKKEFEEDREAQRERRMERMREIQQDPVVW